MVSEKRAAVDDGALVRAVATGSHDALAALYDRHVAGVFAAALRLTSDRQVAEEVVQETFLALWDRAELYDPSAGSLAAWLRTIARNRTVDRLRAAGRRPSLVPFAAAVGGDDDEAGALERLTGSDSEGGEASVGPDPVRAAEARETQAAVQAALSEMPTDERTVIVLAYGQDLTQAEIAERLGWPLGTVKTRTRRALRRLRTRLEGSDDPRGIWSDPVTARERE